MVSGQPLALAEREHPKSWYQERWCEPYGGQMEVVLPDRTRCDCLFETHAVEFDFADKWAEAIGQSLYYAFQTEKRAGIILIMESEDDCIYWNRLISVIDYFNLPIDVLSIRIGMEVYVGLDI